ncbi:hypothetical protein IWX65_001002 [Arthrobacter sp. CAN_A214]
MPDVSTIQFKGVVVLSLDVTWGDMKSVHRYNFGSDTVLSIDHLADRDILKLGYFKHDDEFYYEMDPASVVQARLERWPRRPSPGDHEEFFVTMNAAGTVLLVLVLVNGERFYYRNEAEWVYIGPGDNVVGFDEYSLVAVAGRVVDFFDYAEANEFGLIEESVESLRI